MAEPAVDGGFRTFAIEPPHQVRTLRKLLNAKIGDLAMQLAEGYAKDWGDYRERVGTIAGLKDAIGFCDDMEKAEKK